MAYIYLITNLVNGKAYVGQTRRSVDKRWKEHLKARSAGALSFALRKYGPDAFKIDVLEECYSKKLLNEREVRWIEYLGTMVPNGYNLTTGGDVGWDVSQETRDKLSLASKNMSEEAREKIKLALIGREFSEETRAKLSIALRGRMISDEWRAKIRSAKTNPSAEIRANIGASTRGRVHSDATRAKMRESHLGKCHSPETREKLSALASARTPEHSAKISASLKARYASQISETA